ncbi:MAG TPA: glycosyltransferase family 2 protein [Pyrinomonadaceae bacterium]|nr:glycosyltransferase family 2 protein [Pyrinomonadaceae bacterium]
MDYPEVDIVTVTHNSAPHLKSFFEALRQVEYPPDRLRVIIVDNASSDETRNFLHDEARTFRLGVQIIELPTNEGFGAGCNHGSEAGAAPFILFLNPDAQPRPAMIQQMVVRVAAESNIGLLDVKQDPVDLGKLVHPLTGDTDWCSGGAVLARREAFNEIGGFDPFFFLYCEDVDLSWRMWLAGWRCVTETGARVHHETAKDGVAKPIMMYYSIRNSFAMRMIYDSASGVRSHLVRGLRYLVSPRTVGATRRAVFAGFWFSARRLPHLIERRRAAQAELAVSPEREHFVFNEWFYGRFGA